MPKPLAVGQHAHAIASYLSTVAVLKRKRKHASVGVHVQEAMMANNTPFCCGQSCKLLNIGLKRFDLSAFAYGVREILLNSNRSGVHYLIEHCVDYVK